MRQRGDLTTTRAPPFSTPKQHINRLLDTGCLFNTVPHLHHRTAASSPPSPHAFVDAMKVANSRAPIALLLMCAAAAFTSSAAAAAAAAAATTRGAATTSAVSPPFPEAARPGAAAGAAAGGRDAAFFSSVARAPAAGDAAPLGKHAGAGQLTGKFNYGSFELYKSEVPNLASRVPLCRVCDDKVADVTIVVNSEVGVFSFITAAQERVC